MRILVAEDDRSIQTEARLTLAKLGGHQVVTVENGLEVLKKVRDETFDLIILDGMMPVLDGIPTCRQLKANETTEVIPIIFMTAKNQKTDVEQGFKAGCIGYIVKPFDAQKLCE